MMNDTNDANEDLDDETADSNAKEEKQQEQQHVVVVCDRQQLNRMMLFGVVIILLAVVIGSVCGSGLCSSSSSSNASSTSSTSRGDMPVQGVNSTAQAPMNMVNSSTPMMTPTSSISNPPSAFQSPTRQPSQTISVVTPSPISVGVSTSSPTQSPIPFLQPPVSPTNPPSPTLQTIQARGYLLCGAYDITLINNAGFSDDLVRFGEICSLVNISERELFPSGTFPSSPHFCLFVSMFKLLVASPKSVER
jgi:hypothetical protein